MSPQHGEFMRFLIVIVSYFCVCSSLAASERPLSVVLLNSPYPPYVLAPEQGTGIVLDILNAYSAKTKQPLKIEYAPEVRTLKLIETQQVDARIESEVWFLGTTTHCWSRPLIQVDDVVVIQKNSGISEHRGFNGMVMFARFGYTYPKFEDAVNHGEIERRDFYSELEILLALAKSEVNNEQFGVVAKPTLEWYQRHYALLNERLENLTVIDSAPLQLQFAANDEATKACLHLNQFLDEFLGSKEYYQILKQYQPEH